MSANAKSSMPDPQASAPSGPATAKVLRIGVVVEGKIVQERLIRAGEAVTVGEGPRNTFVLAGTRLGEGQTVFAVKGRQYALSVPEWVEGRLAVGPNAQDLRELRTSNASKVGDLWHYPLTENARGKIAMGAVTLLFQFVPAPPESARAVTASDFRPRLVDNDDPLFLGLLGIFSAVAAASIVWMLTTEVKEKEPDARLIGRVFDIPTPTRDEPEEVEQPQEEAPAEETKAPAEEAPAEAAAAATAEAAAPAAPRTAEDGAKAAQDLLDSLGIVASGSAGDATGPATASASELGDLIAAGNSGNGSATNLGPGIVGATGTGSTGVAVGAGPRVGVGSTAKVVSSAPVKIERSVAPAGKATVNATSGSNADVEASIKRNSARIKGCADIAAKTNESLKGIIGASWQINAGKVSAVRVTTNETKDAAFEACVVKAISAFRFDSTMSGTVPEYQWRVDPK